MKMMLLLTAVCVVVSTAAIAEPSATRSYYDRNGSFAGQSFSRGKETSFSDKSGSFAGSSIRNSDGTTSFYDKSGHFTGSSVDTSRRR